MKNYSLFNFSQCFFNLERC